MTSNFMIGPIKDGVRKDIKPYAIPEDAFESLVNAYQWRGRIVKRSGYTLLGKLPNGLPVMGLKTKEGFNVNVQTLVGFDTTQAFEWNGTAFVLLPSVMPVVWNGTNSDFFFTTNYANAFWATNNIPGLNGWVVSEFANSAGGGNAATVDVTSAGNNVQVNDYVYFINLDTTVSGNAAVLAQVTAAGDPFTVTAINQPTGSTFAWTDGTTSKGMVLDSMQTVSGQDGIRYYGALRNGTGWANYNPPLDTVNALAGALMIFPYRGYLVFLNTWEGNDSNVFNYQNRARWTQIGTPYYSEPVPVLPAPQTFDIKTARDDLFGRGGANDAPTNEAIVAAGFIRDILVVYFERSTWRLRFVNNSQNPFVWERVNIELGSDCTFSTIPFDKGLMAIGDRGIVISDGNDTIRFDEKIPDEVFSLRKANFGFKRVQGIRTFETKLLYWTFPSADNASGTFPDQVLVYNYETKNWSVFDDCFTTFGYFYETSNGSTWADLPNPWASYNNFYPNTGISQISSENIVAGNQQGYVFQLEKTNGQNDPSLSISAITAAVPGVFSSTNNNLPDGTWITLSGITGTTQDDGVSLNGRNFKLSNPTLNANDFTLEEFKPIDGGDATGALYVYTVGYTPILAGSVQINIGADVYFDTNLDGVLYLGAVPAGTIDYTSGTIVLNFAPPIAATPVIIRVVSLDPNQPLSMVGTTGVYGGGGEIAKISNISILTKIFNFFNTDTSAMLSKIDFYTNATDNGQFICNVYADSSDIPVNTPLTDNQQSNVVLTSINQYQVGTGPETIFRLFCNARAQSLQLELFMSDQQMAVSSINRSDIQLLAMMISMRKGGRII